MRHPRVLLGIPLLLGLTTGAATAAESRRYELSVIVDGVAVPEYRLAERTYVEAIRGRNFSLRLYNPGPERVAIAVSVDGRNVIDAKRTTALGAAKWILGAGEVLEVPGWQISGEAARRFFFTETRSSYAKWLGDTRNVGTIEAAFFRERNRWPRYATSPSDLGARERADDAREQAAPESSAGHAPTPPSSVPEEGEVREQTTVRGEAPMIDSKQKRSSESDRFAATGAGERTQNPVHWVDFDEEPDPVARVRLRYEFRPELVRLGVLLPREDLHARERGRGFEPEYAPDPGRGRRR